MNQSKGCKQVKTYYKKSIHNKEARIVLSQDNTKHAGHQGKSSYDLLVSRLRYCNKRIIET